MKNKIHSFIRLCLFVCSVNLNGWTWTSYVRVHSVCLQPYQQSSHANICKPLWANINLIENSLHSFVYLKSLLGGCRVYMKYVIECMWNMLLSVCRVYYEMSFCFSISLVKIFLDIIVVVISEKNLVRGKVVFFPQSYIFPEISYNVFLKYLSKV